MPNKEKIAVFDFCETLANFQTADEYIRYVREKSGNKRMKRQEKFRFILQVTKIMAILNKLFPKFSINKRFVLWQLCGLNRTELEQYALSYYQDVVRPNLINEVITELERLQQSHWRIVIASAGYEIYLKHFCQEYGIPLHDLIAVKIKFRNDICKGVFDGGDKLWNKTEMLDNLFDKEQIVSKAYSDSISDLPLLLWANESYVIRRSDKKRWATNYNFNEIVWKKE